MIRDYISEEELTVLLQDIQQKISKGEYEACSDMVGEIITERSANRKSFDKTYITNLKLRKRDSKMAAINEKLEQMTLEQIDNVYKYVMDEFDEPNHEAEALEAVIALSHRKQS